MLLHHLIQKSHPSRVRGLKLPRKLTRTSSLYVAPFAGAWIEILMEYLQPCKPLSRTLRGCVDWNSPTNCKSNKIWCRTLRGCVDWNLLKYFLHSLSLQSHPSRVRGLKLKVFVFCLIVLVVAPFAGAWIEIFILFYSWWLCWCRTLRGCVDWNQ